MDSREGAVRRTRVDGERTRATILRRAAELATVSGLDGLTIGELAASLRMSKSGVYAHFGSKEELQLATVEEARRIFDVEVFEPAAGAEAGVPRLLRLSDAFFTHLQGRTLPGGCFFAGAALEMGSRPGPVKEGILRFQEELVDTITTNVRVAKERGELSRDEDERTLAFEVNSILIGANTSFVLRGDPTVLQTARAVIARRLAPAVT
jgi:AcrR family transcriptional regulator